MASRQLDLFGAPPPPPEPTLDFEPERQLMHAVPQHVRLGTSSWTFPGWAGLVYPGKPSQDELVRRGLEWYARCPLFRTVGIDRSYYRPIPEPELEVYAEQLPPDFRCVFKAWQNVTAAVDARTRAPNPLFLEPEPLIREMLEPLERSFRAHLGPIVMEIAPLRPNELPPRAEFVRRLDRFLSALPRGFQYAVELRNRELLTHDYLDVLRRHGAGHVLNLWERMPDVGEQLAIPGILTAPVVVARLLIPPGYRYADRKRDLAPFDAVRDEQPKMRTDVIELALACAESQKALFVIVNNKAEGSSPLTVRALAERLAAATAASR